MATDVEKLIVSLEARTKEYEKALARAQGQTVTQMRKIERQIEASHNRIGKGFAVLGTHIKAGLAGALAGLASAQGLGQIREIVGSIADIGDAADRLGLSTDAFQDMAFAAKLAGVEATTLAKGLKILGINSSDAANGQGELGKLLEANGLKLTDANGKMLSQVEILKMVAELVKNAASDQDRLSIANIALGKSGADLLLLLEDGADGVSRAMESAAADTSKFTEEQIRKAQELDDQFDMLAENVSVFLKGAVLTFAQDAIAAFNEIRGYVDGVTDAVVRFIAVLRGVPSVAGGKGDLPGSLDPSTGLPRRAPLEGTINGGGRPTVLPPPPAAKARTPRAPREPRDRTLDEFQRQLEAIRAQTVALGQEAEALDMTAVEAARAAAAHDLLTAAQQAGIKVTPEVSALISQMANEYAAATAKLEALQASQEALNELNGAFKDSARGFVDDLRAGTGAVQALSSALDNLLQKLTDLALDTVFDQIFNPASQGGAGGLAGIFGALFGGFRAAGGPVSSGKGYVVGERGPELFMPKTSGSIIPNGAGRGGGGVNVQIVDQRSRGAPVEQQRGSDGSMRFIIRDEMRTLINSGQMDAPLSARTGGAPRKVVR